MAEKEIQKYIKQLRDEANEDMKKYIRDLNESNLKIMKDIFYLHKSS